MPTKIMRTMMMLILASGLLTSATPSQTLKIANEKTANEVYQDIKRLEEDFPIPTPYATVTIGTFNANTGKFTFAGGVEIKEFDPPTVVEGDIDPLKPQEGETLPHVKVNAVNVGLTFRVTGAAEDFRVIAKGVTVTAYGGQTALTVDVGSATTLNWRVRAGARTYSDRLVINRPPIVGAGVFTIPALPVAIVYEPPPDSRFLNKATYSTTQAIGTTVRMSFSEENSVTTPVRAHFDTVTDIKAAMNRLAGVIQYAPNVPYASQIASALKTIATGLGSVSAAETTGAVVTKDHDLSVVDIKQRTFDTDLNDGGPGIGDMILYLKNAKLVWLAEGGTLKLALLGYEMLENSSAKALRNQESTLDSEVINNLLQLDPFIRTGKYVPVNWQPNLTEPRFYLEDTFSMNRNGGHQNYRAFHQVTQTDLNATENFTMRTEEYREGFLSFLGLGVTENKTLKTTFRHGSSTANTVGETIETSADFYATLTEQYAVEVYYDRLFGTFAFKKVSVSEAPFVSGRVMDRGRPMIEQLVTLILDGKKFSTTTNAEGRYEFRAATIKPGNGELFVGDMKKSVRITGEPIRNFDFIKP